MGKGAESGLHTFPLGYRVGKRGREMANKELWKLDNKVYVGKLGFGAAKQELQQTFSRYGRLKTCWIARNPPGFAFVEYEDRREAEQAVRALDGS